MKRSLFVGRAAEMQRLRDAFGAVGTGGVARVTLVVGEAGIGKTRLLAEFRESVDQLSLCLLGRGSPLSRTIPFAVLVEACESHLRGLQPTELDALAGRRAGELSKLFPSFAPAGPERREHSRLETIEAILYLLTALSAERPLVICLDDLHEADPSTWEVLYYLGRNPPKAPVWVVGAARLEGIAASPAQTELMSALLKDGLADELRLQPLQPADVARLARDALGVERSSEAVATRVYERSGGNPLFAQALLDEPAAANQSSAVPAGVKERVAALMRAQPEALRETLALAATLGHTFSAATMRSLSPGAEEMLDELVRLRFLVERADGVLTTYDFRHPLIREAVYEGIGTATRRRLHYTAATRLAAEALTVRAYHAARGALPGDSEAIGLICDAAREAERAQSSREAIALLLAALQLLSAGSVDTRRELLDELAWQASLANDYPTGIRALDELEPLLTHDPTAMGTLFLRRASFLSTNVGDLEAANHEVTRAIEIFEATGNQGRLAASLNELAWVKGLAGDLESQIELSRSALALAERQEDEDVRLHALGSLGHALTEIGRHDEAEAIATLGCELSARSGDRTQAGWHAGTLGDVYCSRGDFGKAMAVTDAFLRKGPSLSEVFYDYRARAAWLCGRWTDALDCCRVALALNPDAPSRHAAWILSLAGLLEVERDRAEAAGPLLAQADRVYADDEFYWFSAEHRWASGRAHMLMGNRAEARRHFERAERQLTKMKAATLLAQLAPDFVEFLVEEGELTAARDVLARLESSAGSLATEFARAQANSAKAMIMLGMNDRGGAIALFETASAVLRACGAPFLEARCCEYLGRAMDGPSAIESLGRAARLYAALPAPLEERRVLSSLRRLGPRGRRAEQSLGALTPREREVLALARRGLSTRAIAERLFLGDRTVETHLAHIYAKLGIAGRTELFEQA